MAGIRSPLSGYRIQSPTVRRGRDKPSDETLRKGQDSRLSQSWHGIMVHEKHSLAEMKNPPVATTSRSQSHPRALCARSNQPRIYSEPLKASWPTGRTLSSHPPRSSTMATESQRSGKSIDGLLSKMNVAIELLSSAKNARGFAPARIALGFACVLLIAIRVHSLLFFDDDSPVHAFPGHHGWQTRFCRSRTVLR
jgi:hypothetical protein